MISGIIFHALAVALLALSLFTDRAKAAQALRKAWKSLEGILPQFLGIIVLIGILLRPSIQGPYRSFSGPHLDGGGH